ncbi:hypothetical protein V2J09_023009 [Rumex salicifolius]
MAVSTISVVVVMLLSSVVGGMVGGAPPKTELIGEATELYYAGITNLTEFLVTELRGEVRDCITDPVDDWNLAFNYTSNLEFISSCLMTASDLSQRLCTTAELKFYLQNSVLGFNSGKPSRNCNSTLWVNGCEPGWACSVSATNETTLKTSKEIPARIANCQPCCEGFFCPQGLTCMFPCPLGASCQKSKYNATTGLCQPYNYRLPSGHPGHRCGGANVWSRFDASREIFCPEGSYCPTTTEERPCSSGSYCRTGSTTQSRCSKLISCKANTAKQNIHAYGVMLIVVLVALLLIIYNCSDQIISTRDQRRAKSRERAARIVQQSENARLRWKVAKEAAKKHAAQLHATLSSKFSRKDHQGQRVTLNATDNMVDDSLLPNSHDPDRPVGMSESEHHGSSTLEIEHDITTRKTQRQNVSNETQIFKYAYAQIQKEKALERRNENANFSRVISMAKESPMKKRPLIEVSFKDFTLTLKGKKKCLLKCLTGKIMPGRIAAVMGPSGAGKTTFLSALAGKTTGCTRNGLILINGQPESIHSYRKLIGFVPQDDIVHGNLTVEENLWFSARCRLGADLKKVDKILVLERVIENLGLQEVRDSLVGTVEKRGISGGQRKRVNVGLELVTEPSLLFLDEPTSGLDSSSSRLLLQALKHEAHAGVNICMVVHQPSYALYRMFDDLILLAKGGRTVYLGPVSLVEEYFSGIGINVPNHVNPPDYYIDILEGLLEPCTSTSVNYKELPLRWMLHNGYRVPIDMLSSVVGLATATSDGSQLDSSVHEERYLIGELWHDMRNNTQLVCDHVFLNFLSKKDLTNRRTPNIFTQYKYFLGRISKQRLREARLQATDYLILLLAGACLGAISSISDASFGAFSYSYTLIAVASLRTFSLDKLQYWRESASGISSLASFLAKDTVDHFNTLIKPIVYLSMFYFFTNPRTAFLDIYIVLVCLVYCVTGIGYAFAIYLEPGPAQLFSVLLPVCLTLIATQALSNPNLRWIANLSYPKWALEALVVATAKRYNGVWLITRCAALFKFGYTLRYWWYCISIVTLFGVISRILAFMDLDDIGFSLSAARDKFVAVGCDVM